jgi:ParB family transcriptional regulator, chromosome partitioning protein
VPPRKTTLDFRRGAQRSVAVGVSAAEQLRVNSEARRAIHPMKVAWLPLADIDQTPAELNSRSAYDESTLNELAQSIKEVGVLQPICVRPSGERYTVVFGNRRLKAAARAQLPEIPCTIQVADDERAFLLNTVENLHRQQLTGGERVRAIERLAATNLTVTEISLRTGFNKSTISRWLKIDRRLPLKEALESDRLDIGRAMALADAPEDALPQLLRSVQRMSQQEIKDRVVELRNATAPASIDSRRLLELLRLVGLIRSVEADELPLLDEIEAHLARLRKDAFAKALPTPRVA